MPGDPQAWPLVRDMFQRIAAKADDGAVLSLGGRRRGRSLRENDPQRHRYGDMQLIAEAWQLMRDGLGMTAVEIAETFAQWNRGLLSSYLIEITAAILRVTETDGTRASTTSWTRPDRRAPGDGPRSTPWRSACR